MKADTEITTLDAKGLLCPLPVLRTRRALRELAPDQLLRVETTDQAALNDIPAYCAMSGHELVMVGEEDEGVYFLIRKS